MRATNRKLFLLVTAFVEAASGLCLLILPAVPFAILLGVEHATADATLVARIAGAALLAIGIASWIARSDALTPAQLGLLTGVFIYNVVVSMLLAFAGVLLEMIGILLWPAVALHAILAVWSLSCLRRDVVVVGAATRHVDPTTATIGEIADAPRDRQQGVGRRPVSGGQHDVSHG
jgi:hypothetical protein